MTKILVTGANGMLGKDLCPILEQNNYTVIKTNSQIMDITDFELTNKVISEQKPDIIIHCAAYTNVDKAQEDFETAKQINSTGTENLAAGTGQAAPAGRLQPGAGRPSGGAASIPGTGPKRSRFGRS